MDVHEIIDKLLVNTAEIKRHYLTVDTVKHVMKDISYADLKEFAQQHRLTIHTDQMQKRALVIYSPLVGGKMDSDIWLYSKQLNIKPAEITEL